MSSEQDQCAALLANLQQSDAWRHADAWADLLAQYGWQWFVTLTFDPKRRSNPFVHPERAVKSFRLWVSLISRALYGPRWYRKAARGEGIAWVLGLERHKSGVLHMHALMAAPLDLNSTVDRYEGAMPLWHDMEGIARIEPPRGHAQCVAYISKYVIKGGEIEFSDHLDHFLIQSEAWRAAGQFQPPPRVTYDRLAELYAKRPVDRRGHNARLDDQVKDYAQRGRKQLEMAGHAFDRGRAIEIERADQ